MKPFLTIADAAETALRDIGRAATLEEIYAHILRGDLYQFNSPTPEHVLYTTLQRHLDGGTRIDAREEIRFRIDANKRYSLMKSEESPMIGKIRGPKRIMRSADKEEFIQEIMSERVGIFKEIWRLLLFAAQIGIKCDRRESLQSIESGKGIDQATFGNSASWPGILYLMNIAVEEGSEVLGSNTESDDRRIALFQEFANGGLAMMQEFFKDRTIDLEGVIAFIDRHQSTEAASVGLADLDLTI
jgi:dnd system-associated protein 4